MKFDQDVAHDEVLHLAGDELPKKLPTDLSVVTLVVSQFDCGTKQVASGDYFREIGLWPPKSTLVGELLVNIGGSHPCLTAAIRNEQQSGKSVGMFVCLTWKGIWYDRPSGNLQLLSDSKQVLGKPGYPVMVGLRNLGLP